MLSKSLAIAVALVLLLVAIGYFALKAKGIDPLAVVEAAKSASADSNAQIYRGFEGRRPWDFLESEPGAKLKALVEKDLGLVEERLDVAGPVKIESHDGKEYLVGEGCMRQACDSDAMAYSVDLSSGGMQAVMMLGGEKPTVYGAADPGQLSPPLAARYQRMSATSGETDSAQPGSAGSDPSAAEFEQTLREAIFLGEPARLDGVEVALQSIEVQRLILSEFGNQSAPSGSTFIVVNWSWKNTGKAPLSFLERPTLSAEIDGAVYAETESATSAKSARLAGTSIDTVNPQVQIPAVSVFTVPDSLLTAPGRFVATFQDQRANIESVTRAQYQASRAGSK